MNPKDIDELTVSEATLEETPARQYLSWMESGRHPYLEYNETNIDNLRFITNHFINNHAMVDLTVMPYYTPTPIHVFRIQHWNIYKKAEGLIYSNGVVSLYDDVTIRLWIHQDTVKLFKYPHVPKIMPQ